MPIKRIEFQGLESISEAYVRRVVKTRESQPYRRAQVQEDANELLRTRKFLDVAATPRVENGEVVIVFELREKPAVASVEIIGNTVFKTEELFAELGFAAGAARDDYLINKGRDDLERYYREKGYYYATVALDEGALRERNQVIYSVNEGPRVRVRRVGFDGARAFPEPQLRGRVQTQTYFFLLRTGAFDEDQAERDALELQKFYREEGYLDARVGYRLEFDEAERADLSVIFVIEEGARYRAESVEFVGNEVFDVERLTAEIRMKPQDFVRQEVLNADVRRITEMYGELGYIETRVSAEYDFAEQGDLVKVRYEIAESAQSRFGRITIRGNLNTKDEVVRRELRFYPGEYFNTVAARKAEQSLRETGLFSRATITPLPDEDGMREALVEVEEADTVNILFGVGVSTDSGLIGSISIENRNFDIGNWPRTWGELLRGQAFRGDGQRLRIALEPGTELSRFRVDFTEPYLLDQPIRLDMSAYLWQRPRDGYDERRLGFLVGLSRRFEGGLLDSWALEGALRVENVNVSDVDGLAPSDVRNVRGDNFLTSLRVGLVRDTTDSRLFPTEGYRINLSWEQVGALGGDADFGRPSAGVVWYKTLQTDIFDRKSVLALRADAGYITGDAPVFERYYAGGFGSLRGFAFRGVSPRKGVLDTPVGGEFILLTGGEYSFPLYANVVRGVTFLDMGTVSENFGISSWRASVGLGLRVNLDFFGPVPLVFDFGFPIASSDEDNEQIFNFTFGASF